nr:uncharacterized protein LOC119619597 [Chlorocebus sabaeus]
MPEAPAALRSRPTPAAARPRRCWPRRGGGSGRGLEQLRAGPGLWGQGQLRSGVSEQPPGPQVSPCPLPTLHFSSPQWAWCPFAAEGAPRVEEGCGGERRDRWLRGRGPVRQGSRETASDRAEERLTQPILELLLQHLFPKQVLLHSEDSGERSLLCEWVTTSWRLRLS